MMGNCNIGIIEKRFLGWFLKCCVPEVKKHLYQKNKQTLNSVLLILDTDKSAIVNASYVKIVSIPPITTPVLQPMHVGVQKMFTMYCPRHMFDYLADLMRETPELTVREAWQIFSICNTLTIVEESVRRIKQSTVNGAWRTLWNEIVTDSESFLPVVEEIENIVASAKRLGGEGFEDIDFSDVAELLDCHAQKMVEKYFRDVITSEIDKRGQHRLTSRT